MPARSARAPGSLDPYPADTTNGRRQRGIPPPNIAYGPQPRRMTISGAASVTVATTGQPCRSAAPRVCRSARLSTVGERPTGWSLTSSV